jgi:hypothetical protein
MLDDASSGRKMTAPLRHRHCRPWKGVKLPVPEGASGGLMQSKRGMTALPRPVCVERQLVANARSMVAWRRPRTGRVPSFASSVVALSTGSFSRLLRVGPTWRPPGGPLVRGNFRDGRSNRWWQRFRPGRSLPGRIANLVSSRVGHLYSPHSMTSLVQDSSTSIA